MKNIELRDYFAGKALQGLLISHPSLEIENLITTSYNISDKMIQHKSKIESLDYILNSKQIEEIN